MKVGIVVKKLGRNSKCSCGSGKKFKKCWVNLNDDEYKRFLTKGVRYNNNIKKKKDSK